jgi:cephalosporin-C deacetylase-like acetyl esterase
MRLPALLLFTFITFPLTAQTLRVEPALSNGVFAAGAPVAWNITVTGSNAARFTSVRYQIKQWGTRVVREGTLPLRDGSARLTGPALQEPGTLLAEVKASAPGSSLRATGGAVVQPERIAPSLPRPTDFDAFWTDKLAELNAVPASVELEPADSGRPDVEYWKVTLNNIRGHRIHAQLARPKNGTNLPAIVVLQWAGVYGLGKGNVTGRAADGWLALNVMAHDLPLDETPEFYKQQDAGPLKNYGCQGNTNRESSYLLRVFLGAVRATDYLATRPDWNGKTLVTSGTSMGGYQALVVAALSSNVSAVTALVPAGCDHSGKIAGRLIPWPYWTRSNVTPDNEAAILEASRYYDVVNFAPRIRVPVLAGFGLIDTTCPASGVLAMANQLAGPKELVILPLSDHKGTNKSQAPYGQRSGPWLNALRDGAPAPLLP